MSKPKLAKVENVAQLDTRNKYVKTIETMNEVLPYPIQEWDLKATFLPN